MTLTDAQRIDAAMRMIRVVTGEPYGDGEIVTNLGTGYANGDGPSHGMSDVWVTGDWNDVDRYDRETNTRIVVSTLPGRLFSALERIGVNGEWSDEWDQCGNCYKLVRTQPDSYGWTAQYVISDDCEVICRDCMADDASTWVDEHYANEVDRAITWLSVDELVALGWHDAFPDDRDAASGMHPGQNDTPQAMVNHLYANEANDGRDWVFLITDKGQFDIHYRLFVRDDEETDQ